MERRATLLEKFTTLTLLLAGCAAQVDGPSERRARALLGSPGLEIAGESSAPLTGVSDPLAADSGGRVSLGSTPLPCELGSVLGTSCQGCHSAEPGLQAPMALMTREDLLAPAVSDPSRQVYELMLERVHDARAPMPPPSSRRLTASELAAIDAMQGAGPGPSDAADCGGVAPAPSPAPPPAEDLGACYTIRAHELSQAGDTTPHQVEPGEYYSCFYFDMPWPDAAQAIRIRTDAGPSVHHVELFHLDNPGPAGQVLGQQANCGATPRSPLAIWVAGVSPEQNMPPEVGLTLPPRAAGRGLLLEVHYSNPSGTLLDDSGVEICTAASPRPIVAAISTVGAPSFSLPPGQQTTVNATCTPVFDGEVHMFRSIPHMHARGQHFVATIARASGTQEPLLDVPFDANNQQTYELDEVMRPGDKLLTSCTYLNATDHTISQGYTSDDEMCNHFIYAWPAGALSPAGLGTSLPCVF